jgi:hypothetical protein
MTGHPGLRYSALMQPPLVESSARTLSTNRSIAAYQHPGPEQG